MELDKIVYDKDKLAQAITDQLLAESPTFNSMYPSDTATALVNVLAAYGSMMNYFFASAMANCYTDSAFSDTGIRQLAKTLGNRLHGNEPAQTFITIRKNNLQAKDISIPAYSSFTINNKKFFNPSAVILSATNPVVTQVPLIQGEIVSVDKVTSGIAGEKLYFSSNYKASMNYTTVTVGESVWEIVDSFLPYDENYVEDTSETNKVVLETEADGRCYIKFGDGVLGTLPASGTNVNIKYVSNDGELGNVPQINLDCTLTTPLVYINSLNNQETLDITAYTTSTIYGGFGKQSIETLRLTSPYVFASGHRAIRRKDYIGLLQNQCGYLTSSVWGEYEESQYKGTYDALMMNMVYYSGIKSYENYSDYEIGALDTTDRFISSSNTTRAFWGTYNLKVNNMSAADGSSNKYFSVEDTGAKGLLFINDDKLDKRDSLLTPWVNTTGNNVIDVMTNDDPTATNYMPIENARTDKDDDVYYSSDHATISLLTPKQILIDCHLNPKTLTAIKFKTNSPSDPFISAFTIYGTRDVTEETIGDWTSNPLFVNIRNSANWDNLTGRVTLAYPGAEKWTNWIPTNLAMDLNSDESYKSYNYYVIEVYDVNQRAASDRPQLVFNKIKGLFIEDSSTIAYDDNGKVNIKFPEAGVSGASENYIISDSQISNYGEGYVVGDILKVMRGTTDTTLRVRVTAVDGTGKIQAIQWVDGINYYKTTIGQFNNTIVDLVPVTLNCDGEEAQLTLSSVYCTHLVENLIGSNDYPLYYYTPEYEGLTRANGYRSGNQLAYIYSDSSAQDDVLFITRVDNIDSGTTTACLGKHTPVAITAEGSALNYELLDYNFNTDANNLKLVGNLNVVMSNPASLDELPIYEFTSTVANKAEGSADQGYDINDELKILVATTAGGSTYVDTGARIVVDNVSAGIVTAFHWKTPYVTTGNLNGLIAHTEPVNNSPGTGLIIEIKTNLLSGSSAGAGSGAKINIKSDNNLVVTASFTGNRIDTNDINRVDQPIINKYNHFTTYTEFVQPEAHPVEISLDVSLDTSYSRSSGIIIQEIKNAVTHLFDITPDFLGSGLKVSDVYTAVMDVPGVNWCLVTAPTNNIEVKQNELMTLKGITVNEVIKEFK